MNTPFRGSFANETERARDLKDLRVVVALHYVAGALLALFSCVFVVPIWFGARFGKIPPSAQAEAAGPLLATMGSVGLVVGWAMACALVHAGRSIDLRRRLRRCQLVAALSTLWFPFGTGLGIFTLILLGKPHVRAQFGEDAPVPLASAPTPFADDAAWAGWVSPDAKRRFSRQTILVGVVLVLIGFAVSGGEFAWTFSNGMLHNRPVLDEGESAVMQADRMWFIERMSQPSETGSKRLANVRADNDESPVAGPALPTNSRFLAADGQSLWVLGGKTLSKYAAGHLTTFPSSDAPRWPSRPFDYGGHPAFFDWNRRSDEIRMVRLENEEWRGVSGSSWKTSSALPSLPRTWVVLPADAGFDVFMQFGMELRWRHIGADDGLGDPLSWALVSSSAGYWAAVRLGNESVIVLPTREGLFERNLSLLHRTEGGWVVTGKIPAAAWASLAAISSGSDAMDLVLSQANGVETLAVSGGKVQTRHGHSHASAVPLDVRAMIGMTLFGFIPSLLAAALLGRLMRRDRTGVLAGARQLRFASLLRRGMASGIDHSPAWVVMFAVSWPFLRSPPDVSMMLLQLGRAMVVGLGAVIGTLLITSFMEGRWGTTPGKWLLGIRVVDINGNVCGFWRALLRGALRVIDGSLGFLVGIFVVAFTPNWQRVGDLAAKTVVVRVLPAQDAVS